MKDLRFFFTKQLTFTILANLLIFVNVAKADDYSTIDVSAYSKQARLERQEEENREIQLQRYQQQNYFHQQRKLDQQNSYNQTYHSREKLDSNFDQGDR